MEIIDLLANDNYIIANKTIAHLYGLEEAILLGELASEYKYWKREDKLTDGYFFSTIENVKENTTLSDKRQRSALITLKEAGIVKVQLKGIPAKRYIKIEVEQLLRLLTSKDGQNGKASFAEMAELEGSEGQGNNNKPNSNKNSNKKKRERKVFVPPTLEEVEDYCKERKNNVNAKKFYDYFTASDWVDSKGKKVQSWKQKIITWESYSDSNQKQNKTYGVNGIAINNEKSDLEKLF